SIGKFQSVSNRVVDMTLRLETSRLMVYRYAWLKAQGRDATAAASMAKLHVSECFVQNSLDAIRVFGASGYATETGLERELRDSRSVCPGQPLAVRDHHERPRDRATRPSPRPGAPPVQGSGVGTGRGHPRRPGAHLFPGPRSGVLPGVQPPDLDAPRLPVRR